MMTVSEQTTAATEGPDWSAAARAGGRRSPLRVRSLRAIRRGGARFAREGRRSEHPERLVDVVHARRLTRPAGTAPFNG